MPFSGRGLSVSASIGVVCFSGELLGAEHLIQQADAAMYASKAAGKGRVTVLQPKSVC